MDITSDIRFSESSLSAALINGPMNRKIAVFSPLLGLTISRHHRFAFEAWTTIVLNPRTCTTSFQVSPLTSTAIKARDSTAACAHLFQVITLRSK